MVARTVRAAGGIVYRETSEGVGVVLIHRPHYDDWSLPKGKLDVGEAPVEAALREVVEETGLACRVEQELPPVEYTDHRGRPKHVRYWLMTPLDPDVEIGAKDSEVDLVRWMPIPAALEQLTYPLDREVLQSAAARLGVTTSETPWGDHLAAIDLGSNSFRLVIARSRGDSFEAIDRLREGVRLAASLDEARHLTESGQQRALVALARFGQRIKELSPRNVRAVGTNTLRRARNRAEFLERAEAALGCPIEIVSGEEEARLIYAGVLHSVPPTETNRLVVDIGGGSTELIVGSGPSPLSAESLSMGCVSFSQRFFGKGVIRGKDFKRAILAARVELQPVAKTLRRLGWTELYGASGTVKAVEALLVDAGWSEGGITYAGMKRLRKQLISCGQIDQLKLPVLSVERARVLPGGLAILMAIFKALKIDAMNYSPGALREGVIYDLVGRIHHRDIRDDTIRRMVELYSVDLEQAQRVEWTCSRLLESLIEPWSLDRDQAARFSSWGATLHEIGLALSHSGYHRHGGYLVENSFMPGFSRQEQSFLGAMVRSHRGKLRREAFDNLLPSLSEAALRLTLVLRLGVLLNRSRSTDPLPAIEVCAEDRLLHAALPSSWLSGHPLTREDLRGEARMLKSVGYEFRFDTPSAAKN